LDYPVAKNTGKGLADKVKKLYMQASLNRTANACSCFFVPNELPESEPQRERDASCQGDQMSLQKNRPKCTPVHLWTKLTR
jgi:hypothetical protein